MHLQNDHWNEFFYRSRQTQAIKIPIVPAKQQTIGGLRVQQPIGHLRLIQQRNVYMGVV